jgi:hypothetical protein
VIPAVDGSSGARDNAAIPFHPRSWSPPDNPLRRQGAGTMNLYVGTSGYSYKEWKGTFYPVRPNMQSNNGLCLRR